MEKHLLITRFDVARAARGEMLAIEDVLEILSVPLLRDHSGKARRCCAPRTSARRSRSPQRRARRRAPTRRRRGACARRGDRDDDPERPAQEPARSPARTESRMTLFGFVRRGVSAPVARERLQILLEYERPRDQPIGPGHGAAPRDPRRHRPPCHGRSRQGAGEDRPRLQGLGARGRCRVPECIWTRECVIPEGPAPDLIRGWTTSFSDKITHQRKPSADVLPGTVGSVMHKRTHDHSGTEILDLGRSHRRGYIERELILETLRHCHGNRTRAANILGISIRTIRNKLHEYAEDQGRDIPPPHGDEGRRIARRKSPMRRRPGSLRSGCIRAAKTPLANVSR